MTRRSILTSPTGPEHILRVPPPPGGHDRDHRVAGVPVERAPAVARPRDGLRFAVVTVGGEVNAAPSASGPNPAVAPASTTAEPQQIIPCSSGARAIGRRRQAMKSRDTAWTPMDGPPLRRRRVVLVEQVVLAVDGHPVGIVQPSGGWREVDDRPSVQRLTAAAPSRAPPAGRGPARPSWRPGRSRARRGHRWPPGSGCPGPVRRAGRSACPRR